MPDSSARYEPTLLALQQQPVVDGVERIALELDITRDIVYFEGHFDELAVLPGVTQLHWAVTFGRRYFAMPPTFAYLTSLKFVRIMTPGNRPLLSLEFDPSRGELRFRYDLGETPCSSGCIGFRS
jgi:3-hydroxymyristoyl/3-hydroxydecanoyl-(acyl carrier protein) dehydratase